MHPSGLDSLGSIVAKLDNNPYGRPLVALCVGCFDLFHAGHLHLFQEARREIREWKEWPYGNHPRRLVVAVNTDESVRSLKGEGRPFYSLADRMAIVAALEVVDHVVAFDGNPSGLIDALKPKLYVKGDDRAEAELPERDAVLARGGRIHLVQRLPGHSTTALIERLRGA